MRKDIKLLPSRELLWSLFNYYPLSGLITWNSPRTGMRDGQEAGTVTECGYLAIGIKQDGETKYYLAQRLVWKMMMGDDPPEFIDHIDGGRLNLAWGNLRAATNGQNIQNSKRRKDNMSGIKGVSWDAGHKKWRVVITVGGKHHRLGRYAGLAEAAIIAETKRAELHQQFARST